MRRLVCAEGLFFHTVSCEPRQHVHVRTRARCNSRNAGERTPLWVARSAASPPQPPQPGVVWSGRTRPLYAGWPPLAAQAAASKSGFIVLRPLPWLPVEAAQGGWTARGRSAEPAHRPVVPAAAVTRAASDAGTCGGAGGRTYLARAPGVSGEWPKRCLTWGGPAGAQEETLQGKAKALANVEELERLTPLLKEARAPLWPARQQEGAVAARRPPLQWCTGGRWPASAPSRPQAHAAPACPSVRPRACLLQRVPALSAVHSPASVRHCAPLES